MKKQTKATLIALAIVSATAASQAAAYNNDLIIGFSSTTGNDLLYDLGSVSSLTAGETWNLSSLLSGYNLSTVNWGVVGNSSASGSSRILYTTFGSSPATAGTGRGNSVNTADGALYSNFATAGAGQFASVDSTTDNSWNHQTINPTLTTQYLNAWESPNTVGAGSINFWTMQANSSAGNQDQFFTLGSDGVVTFAAVPEPSTYGLFAGAGLLAVCLRNQFRRKQA
jgi:hypothetical protein